MRVKAVLLETGMVPVVELEDLVAFAFAAGMRKATETSADRKVTRQPSDWPQPCVVNQDVVIETAKPGHVHMTMPQEVGELTAFLFRPSQPPLDGAVLDVNGGSYLR